MRLRGNRRRDRLNCAHALRSGEGSAPQETSGRTHAPLSVRAYITVTFADLGIEQDMVDALATKGIIEPFPIQEQTIPMGLSGQDIIGQAKTGTGKTLGFGLPLLQSLGTDPEPGVKALVVVPTRELCVQVAEDLVLAASNRSTKIAAIYGGKAYEALIRGDWKLMQNDPFSPLELYNLKSDPQETANVATKAPKVLNELSEALRRQIQRGGSTPWQRTN